MKPWKLIHTLALGSCTLVAAALLLPTSTRSQGKGTPPNVSNSANGDGISQTITTYPSFDTTNPFFKPLGTNGRTCATCHPVGQGMVITPDYATQVFKATQGLDPLFATVDGANAPNLNMSTVAARQANCSMLLTKGLIRINLAIPPNAEFTLLAVDDPYHYANANNMSCFRRPLPSTNLRFLSSVMWDGRELLNNGGNLTAALESQIRDAVLGHMQGKTPPTATQVAQILDFETHLYTAQVYDNDAGNLTVPGIGGGPGVLLQIPYFPGINDAFGLVRNPQPFDPEVFDLYTDWLPQPLPPRRPGPPRPGMPPPPPPPTAAQQSVARGQQLFNTRQFVISGVAGLNDVTGRPAITGTCSSCHSTADVGSNSLPLLLNTGIADGSRRTPDMPLYTLRNKFTGATVQTTDPGTALTTGKWADIGKFKVPALRGLEDLSPYMHNGFSGNLQDILDFYDTRFNIGLTPQEKDDLEAFLTTL